MRSSLGLFLSCWEMKPVPQRLGGPSRRHGACWSLALGCPGKQSFRTFFLFCFCLYASNVHSQKLSVYLASVSI